MARKSDRLAHAVSAYLNKQGVAAPVLSRDAAVERLEVSIHGEGGQASPAIPALIRDFGDHDDGRGRDEDEEFISLETTALLWSYGAINPKKVVNRPTRSGLFRRVAGISSITEEKCGLCAQPEVFASDVELSDEGWWAETEVAMRFVVRGLPADSIKSPCRLRPGCQRPGYSKVFLVGPRTWVLGPDEICQGSLSAQSTRIADRLGLDLATVTWRVDPTLSTAVLAAVNPLPELTGNLSVDRKVISRIGLDLVE